MSLLVPVKLYYGDEIRATEVFSQLSLTRVISSLFFSDNPKPVSDLAIKYKDLDDDLVTLKTEADFRIACINLGLVRRGNGEAGRKTMKVFVTTHGHSRVPNPPPALPCLKPAVAETDGPVVSSPEERGSGDLNKGKSYRLLARFVEHVTYPVGAKVLPGENFVKTWRVRNDAERAWPQKVELIYVSGEAGDMMGSIAAFPQVGGLQPGQVYDVSVNLKACSLPGTYEGFWRLRGISEGLKFGQRLRVSIQVVKDTRPKALLGETDQKDDVEMEEKTNAGDMEKLALDGSDQAGSKLGDDFECVDHVVEGTPIATDTLAENESEDVFVEVLPNDAAIPDEEPALAMKDEAVEDVGHDIVKVLTTLGVDYADYKHVNEMRHVKVAYGKLKKHVQHMVRQTQRRRARKHQGKVGDKDKMTKVA